MSSTNCKLEVVYITCMFLTLTSCFQQSATSIISSNNTLQGSFLQIDSIENLTQPISHLDDTLRVDPLDHFNKYRGGYDITNKHYWTATIFTGVYGYAIGVLWLLCGMTYGTIFFFVTEGNRKLRKIQPCNNKKCYIFPIIFSIFFTILTISSTGLFLGGNAKFNSQAKTIVKIIIQTADEATETIYKTTGAMKGMRNNLGLRSNETSDEAFLSTTSRRLNLEANSIQMQATQNNRLIHKALNIMYIITTTIVCLNLIGVNVLLVCGIFRLQKALPLVIILCWLMTSLCWFLFGIYFFLQKFSSDTCNALESFQENPYNNSMNSILPCNELLLAKPVLSDVRAGIYNLVNEVNQNISVLQTTMSPNLGYVCNLFSAPPDFEYNPSNCQANSISIGDIPKILKIFTCSNSSDESCENRKFISRKDYKRVEAYTSSIQTLLNAYPGMENLVHCESVRASLSVIFENHCKPLQKYSHISWSAMMFLSVIDIVLVLIWTAQARHSHCLFLDVPKGESTTLV